MLHRIFLSRIFLLLLLFSRFVIARKERPGRRRGERAGGRVVGREVEGRRHYEGSRWVTYAAAFEVFEVQPELNLAATLALQTLARRRFPKRLGNLMCL